MILRLDVISWATAALLTLATGLWQLRGAPLARERRDRRRLPLLLMALGLVALSGGIVWHPWRGTTGEDALALLAAGTLCCGLYQEWRKSSMPDELQPAADLITGMALAATSMLIAVAALAAWHEPWQAGPDEAQGWLFGVRGVLAGLGLGGWLFIAAGALSATVADLSRQGKARRQHDRIVPRVGEQWDGDGASVAEAGLRFSYPWLAGALIAGAAWSLTIFAVPWRGQPGEIWLAANTFIGLAYLQRASGTWPTGTRFVSYVLAAAGLATALMAAWQVPTLYS